MAGELLHRWAGDDPLRTVKLATQRIDALVCKTIR